MAHLQNWFGLLPPDIATILPWSESPDKSLINPTGTNYTIVTIKTSQNTVKNYSFFNK